MSEPIPVVYDCMIFSQPRAGLELSFSTQRIPFIFTPLTCGTRTEP
jgi:hypothetical protein